MKHQVFNPYLPSWEYVPDGEALSVSVPMNSSAAFSVAPGTRALFFTYRGEDAAGFIGFSIT